MAEETPKTTATPAAIASPSPNRRRLRKTKILNRHFRSSSTSETNNTKGGTKVDAKNDEADNGAGPKTPDRLKNGSAHDDAHKGTGDGMSATAATDKSAVSTPTRKPSRSYLGNSASARRFAHRKRTSSLSGPKPNEASATPVPADSVNADAARDDTTSIKKATPDAEKPATDDGIAKLPPQTPSKSERLRKISMTKQHPNGSKPAQMATSEISADTLNLPRAGRAPSSSSSSIPSPARVIVSTRSPAASPSRRDSSDSSIPRTPNRNFPSRASRSPSRRNKLFEKLSKKKAIVKGRSASRSASPNRASLQAAAVAAAADAIASSTASRHQSKSAEPDSAVTGIDAIAAITTTAASSDLDEATTNPGEGETQHPTKEVVPQMELAEAVEMEEAEDATSVPPMGECAPIVNPLPATQHTEVDTAESNKDEPEDSVDNADTVDDNPETTQVASQQDGSQDDLRKQQQQDQEQDQDQGLNQSSLLEHLSNMQPYEDKNDSAIAATTGSPNASEDAAQPTSQDQQQLNQFDDPALEEIQSEVSVASSGFDMRSILQHPPSPPPAAKPSADGNGAIPEEAENDGNEDLTWNPTATELFPTASTAPEVAANSSNMSEEAPTAAFPDDPFAIGINSGFGSGDTGGVQRPQRQATPAQVASALNMSAEAPDMFETDSLAPSGVTDFSAGVPTLAADIEHVANQLLQSHDEVESRAMVYDAPKLQQGERETDAEAETEIVTPDDPILACRSKGSVEHDSSEATHDIQPGADTQDSMTKTPDEEALLRKVHDLKQKRDRKQDEAVDMFDTGSWAHTDAGFSDISLSKVTEKHDNTSSYFLKMMKSNNERMASTKGKADSLPISTPHPAAAAASAMSMEEEDDGEEKKAEPNDDDKPLLTRPAGMLDSSLQDTGSAAYSFMLTPMEERLRVYNAPNERDDESSLDTEKKAGGDDGTDDGDEEVSVSYMSQHSQHEDINEDMGMGLDDMGALTNATSGQAEDLANVSAQDAPTFQAAMVQANSHDSADGMKEIGSADQHQHQHHQHDHQSSVRDVAVELENLTFVQSSSAAHGAHEQRTSGMPEDPNDADTLMFSTTTGTNTRGEAGGFVVHGGNYPASVVEGSVTSSSLFGENYTATDSVGGGSRLSSLATNSVANTLSSQPGDVGSMPPPPPPPGEKKKKKKRRHSRSRSRKKGTIDEEDEQQASEDDGHNATIPLLAPPPEEKLKKWEDSKMRAHNHLAEVKAQKQAESSAVDPKPTVNESNSHRTVGVGISLAVHGDDDSDGDDHFVSFLDGDMATFGTGFKPKVGMLEMGQFIIPSGAHDSEDMAHNDSAGGSDSGTEDNFNATELARPDPPTTSSVENVAGAIDEIDGSLRPDGANVVAGIDEPEELLALHDRGLPVACDSVDTDSGADTEVEHRVNVDSNAFFDDGVGGSDGYKDDYNDSHNDVGIDDNNGNDAIDQDPDATSAVDDLAHVPSPDTHPHQNSHDEIDLASPPSYLSGRASPIVTMDQDLELEPSEAPLSPVDAARARVLHNALQRVQSGHSVDQDPALLGAVDAIATDTTDDANELGETGSPNYDIAALADDLTLPPIDVDTATAFSKMTNHDAQHGSDAGHGLDIVQSHSEEHVFDGIEEQMDPHHGAGIEGKDCRNTIVHDQQGEDRGLEIEMDTKVSTGLEYESEEKLKGAEDDEEAEQRLHDPPTVTRRSIAEVSSMVERNNNDDDGNSMGWDDINGKSLPPRLFTTTSTSLYKSTKKLDSSRSPTHISTILGDQKMAERVAVASSAAAVKLEEELANAEPYSIVSKSKSNETSPAIVEPRSSPMGFCGQDTTPTAQVKNQSSSALGAFFSNDGVVCSPINMSGTADEEDEKPAADTDNLVDGGAFMAWTYPDNIVTTPSKASSNTHKSNHNVDDVPSVPSKVSQDDDQVSWLFAQVLKIAELQKTTPTERFQEAQRLLEEDANFNVLCQHMTDAVNTTTNELLEAGTFEELKNMETDESTIYTYGSALDDHVSTLIEEKRPRLRAMSISTDVASSGNPTSPHLAAANFVSFLYLASRLSKVQSPFGRVNPFLQQIVDLSLKKAKGDAAPGATIEEAAGSKTAQEVIFGHPDGSIERILQFMFDVCKACDCDSVATAPDDLHGSSDKLLIDTFANDGFMSSLQQDGGKTPKSRNVRPSRLYLVPTEHPSPFDKGILEAPRVLIGVLNYLGDPVAVCRMKMVNRFCHRIVSENEHVLMRDAVRAGGMSMNVRPAFWMWITLQKLNGNFRNGRGENRGDIGGNLNEDGANAVSDDDRNLVMLSQEGEDSRWSHIIERDVARSFGNMPPHKTGARLRTDSIVRALVTWGRNRIMSRGVKGGGDVIPTPTVGTDGKLQKERARPSTSPPPWEQGDDASAHSEVSQTPTDTVSDWGGVSPVGSFTGSLSGMQREDSLDRSASLRLTTPAEDLALSGNALTDEMKSSMKKKLGFILHALSAAHPDVGYCQGMDYVVAHLLRILQDTVQWKCAQGTLPSVVISAGNVSGLSDTVPDVDALKVIKGEVDKHMVLEETVFRVMDTFFTTYNLRHMYWPELRCLKICCRVFERLIQIKLPVLADHFEHHELNVGLFALGWFQTLFLYLPSMPSATVCHMWDIWLVERSFKIFFRVGTAILFLSQPILLNHELEGMMTYLNTFPDATLLNPDILIACALNIKVTNSMLAELESEVVAETC